MPRLHIALQEGFAGDPVSISVDGREIYRKDGVRTRTQIGLADSIETTHDQGQRDDRDPRPRFCSNHHAHA